MSKLVKQFASSADFHDQIVFAVMLISIIKRNGVWVLADLLQDSNLLDDVAALITLTGLARKDLAGIFGACDL